MSDKNAAASFLQKYNFNQPEVVGLTKSILLDMENGLTQKSTLTKIADEPMLVAAKKIPSGLKKNSSTIVIDAGGTNFRSCLVNVDDGGQISISELEKTKMPGIDKELSKDEFYDAIAANLDHLKNKSDRIGFCFSYAMEIGMDGDGRVLVFSKEIKAPEAIGTFVGKELKKALARRGWNPIEKIVLLNDTTASLLAGVAGAKSELSYSSYVGFILGTGMNNAYIEYNPIEKLFKNGDRSQEHIVVCECGMFGKIAQSDFDMEVDKASANPGASRFEKMCSGAYLGSVAYEILKKACADSLFSDDFNKEFTKINKVMPKDMDDYLNLKCNTKDFLVSKNNCILGKCVSSASDAEILSELLLAVYERAARIVTAILSASILKSGKGTENAEPVCVVANGSTFWKAFGLYDRVVELLTETLSEYVQCDNNENWLRFYEIVKIEDDITLGTSVAAFM